MLEMNRKGEVEMKKLKYLAIGLFALAIVGVGNVNALEFNDIIADLMAPEGYDIGSTSEEIVFEGETWIGENGRITIKEGNVNVKLDAANEVVNIVVDKDSEVVINEGKQFIMQLPYNGETYQIQLTISEGATLNVDGALAVPTGSKGILTNDGTINVNGRLEVRSDGIYTGKGITNIYGNLAIYCTDLANVGVTSLNLYDKGNIYSQVDVSDLVKIGATAPEGYITTVLEDTNKEYTSITDTVGTVEFGYHFSLNTVEVSDEEEDDPTIGDSTGDEETPTTPEEKPTTPPEEETPTTPGEEVPEVPQTYDDAVVSIVMGAGALAIVVAAVVLAKKKILFN